MAGSFIAFMGIPGAGKSSICTELASRLGASAFLEPEVWPDAVGNRDVSGAFTALSWFRSMRVPNLYNAAAHRDEGGIALVDSYYDKLCADYLESPEMTWLLPPEDPWHDVGTRMAALDWQLLPRADCVVVLEVDETTWHRFLRARGRALDDAFGLSDEFACQPVFGRAAERYANETGAKLVRFQQTFDSPDAAAHRLHHDLVAAGVIAETTLDRPTDPS